MATASSFRPTMCWRRQTAKRPRTRLRKEITEEILREANLDERVAAALTAADLPGGEKLREQIEEAFEDEPAQSWRNVLDPDDEEDG